MRLIQKGCIRSANKKKKKVIIGKMTWVAACMLVVSFLNGCDQKDHAVCQTFNLFTARGAVLNDSYVYEENGILYIQNIKNNQSMVFCSRTNCKHEPFDEEENPDPKCEAAVRPGCYQYQVIGISEGKVYAFESLDDLNEMALYSRDIEGQGWSKIGTIPWTVYGQGHSYFVDGYAYIDGYRSNRESIVSAQQEESVVLKVNLSNGKYTEIGSCRKADGMCRIEQMDMSDGMLCYENVSLKEGCTLEELQDLSTEQWDPYIEIEICIIDLESGKEKKIEVKDGISYTDYIVYENKNLYYKKGNEVFCYDTEQDTEQIFLDKIKNEYTVSGYTAYGIRYFDSKNESEEQIYSFDSKKWVERVENSDILPKQEGASIVAWTATDVGILVYQSDESDNITNKQIYWMTWEQYQSGEYEKKDV